MSIIQEADAFDHPKQPQQKRFRKTHKIPYSHRLFKTGEQISEFGPRIAKVIILP